MGEVLGSGQLALSYSSSSSSKGVWRSLYKLPQWGTGQNFGRLTISLYSFRFSGILFCYIIKGKHLQKSLNLAAMAVVLTPSPEEPEITRGGWDVFSTVTQGFNPPNPLPSQLAHLMYPIIVVHCYSRTCDVAVSVYQVVIVLLRRHGITPSLVYQ